ncbi:MAG: circularly permuted type 2 ATP-grasp protein [Planctomycetes bacterium]|nr:circularly permuted type 2 ATP-grasp protein [Planctomycetota bacterium]
MSSASPPVDSSLPDGPFRQYTPPAGGYDEVLSADGRLRGPWARFVGRLSELGPSGLAQRSDYARRLLRENGVTYNVFGAPEGPDRPWELDPIPLLIEKREWDPLAAGLAQRAMLLNSILADIYGSQQLVRSGLLPPELVFGHSGFLYPCHGLNVAQNIWLHLYASHLARGPDGRWVVLADRTQGPSGAGYAVENRIIISRTLPNDFHSLHVERLAGFFSQLRETLHSLAPNHRDNPRVVLLSPGPRSSTYFEDAYLARYLGYTLAEGGDLTVRDTSVYLKTLGGLLPVDVILRRLSDEDCDPLELRPDSALGVSGLVQAARSGQVSIANSLGSGYLEAPALMALLPEICQHLLGEELKLPSVPTWWCAREEDRLYVESHLEELTIRPAILHRGSGPIFGSRLTRQQRIELLEVIRQSPAQYVAQPQVARSTAPVWACGGLQPWQVGVRVFAAAVPDGSYLVMPGGLLRASSGNEAMGESISGGQLSKDLWVLAEGPVKTVTLLKPPGTAVELRRSTNDLPSRVADHLYWLGRQVERAEGMVRHLRSIVVRMTNELDPGGLPELVALVQSLTEFGQAPVSQRVEAEEVFDALQTEVISFIFDAQRNNGLYATIMAVHRSASAVRDRISIDSWRIVNQLDIDMLFPRTASMGRMGEVLLGLNQMLNLLAALSGLGTESMTRGPGWRFLDMGRRIERGRHTAQLLQRTLVRWQGDLLPLLESLLEIADSSMTYRYRYLAALQPAPVLDLLLTDETNPRSVGFQLCALFDHVRQLPAQHSDPLRNPEQRITLAAQAASRLADVEALVEPDEHGVRKRLEDFLEQTAHQLSQLSDSMTHTYLAHTGPSRQLGSASITSTV